jgi:hypothetical protein
MRQNARSERSRHPQPAYPSCTRKLLLCTSAVGIRARSNTPSSPDTPRPTGCYSTLQVPNLLHNAKPLLLQHRIWHALPGRQKQSRLLAAAVLQPEHATSPVARQENTNHVTMHTRTSTLDTTLAQTQALAQQRFAASCQVDKAHTERTPMHCGPLPHCKQQQRTPVHARRSKSRTQTATTLQRGPCALLI